eukprot:s2483_g6.t1
MGSVASAEDAERSEVLALQAARDKMQEELHRMQYESLEGSSSTIGKTQTAMQEYDSKLASAAKALGQLKRRMEEDSRYIWWSFYFFLAVVAYIVLRRLKVFKMMYYGASWTAWSGNTVLGTVQSIYLQLLGQPEVLQEIPPS